MNRSPLVEFNFVDPVTNKKRNENCCASNDQISTIREIEGESLMKKKMKLIITLQMEHQNINKKIIAEKK